MAGAFGAALVLATIVLAAAGTDRRGIDQGLLATGRLAFLFFLPAYTGGALVSLFGPIFQPVKQRARDCGLAYASVQVVHLGLVVWVCMIGAVPAPASFVFFGIAVLCTYVLALSSIGAVRRAFSWLAVSPGYQGLLRAAAMNYIAYVFAADFLKDPLHGGGQHILEYLPFATLALLGPTLRLAALVQRSWNRVRCQSYRQFRVRQADISTPDVGKTYSSRGAPYASSQGTGGSAGTR